jgi:hypothetical protein
MSSFAVQKMINWRYEMFWKWLWKVVAILLVLAVFVGGGVAIYRSGYADGVTAAAWEVDVGEDAPTGRAFPFADPYYRSYARYRLFFPGFYLLLGFIMILFIFGGIGRMIRYSMWRYKGMPYPPHWEPGWHKYHHRHKDEPPSHWKSSKGDESENDETSNG